MTERRPPYLADCQPEITLTPLEMRVVQLEQRLRIACGVIQALLDDEGLQRCPNCGWRLKGEDDEQDRSVGD